VTASAALATLRPNAPSHAKRNLAILVAAAIVSWAFLTVDVRLDRLIDLPRQLGRMFGFMFLPPDWSYVEIAAPAMVASIQMAWIGTLIGAILSLPLGFFGAKNISSGPVSNVVRVLLNAIRAFPEIVLAIVVFVPIAGLGPVGGALAIGVHSIGTLGKLTAEAAMKGLWEAGYATRWLPGQDLPNGLRITIGTEAQVRVVADTLRAMAESA